MLLANAPAWMLLLLQQIFWTGLVWLGWQVVRRFVSLSAAQIYWTNVVLQLSAAMVFVCTASYAIQNDGWQLAYASNGFQLTQYIYQFPFVAEALLLLYYVAIALQVAQWMMGLSGVRRLMRSGVPADAALMDLLQQQQALIALDRHVQLKLSAAVTSPLTIGWLKPMILLPMAAVNQLTPKELEALLVHELVHIRRYDYLVNHALVLSKALLCFNPFIWLLHEETILYREISCDDAVRSKQDTTVYAGALYRMAQLQQHHVLAMQATGSKDGLRKRIAYMLSPMQAFQLTASRFIIAIFGLSALALLLFFSARTAQEKRISKRKAKRANTRMVVAPKPIMASNQQVKTNKTSTKKKITQRNTIFLEQAIVASTLPSKPRKTWSDIETVVEERPKLQLNPIVQRVSDLNNKQILQQLMQQQLVSAAGLLQQLKQEKELSTQEKLWLLNYILERSGIQFDENNRIILPDGVDMQSLEKLLRNRNLLLRERVIPDSLLPKKIQ
jgi:beta-lactamase regulating signal transducer with metallopeptidase domain